MKPRGVRPVCYTSPFLLSPAEAASQSDRFVAPDSVCSCSAPFFSSLQSHLSLDVTDAADCPSSKDRDGSSFNARVAFRLFSRKSKAKSAELQGAPG